MAGGCRSGIGGRRGHHLPRQVQDVVGDRGDVIPRMGRVAARDEVAAGVIAVAGGARQLVGRLGIAAGGAAAWPLLLL